MPREAMANNQEQYNYVIGSLFPRKENGTANVILAKGLKIDPKGTSIQRDGQAGDLNTTLAVTTEPITIKGISNFVRDYYLPQLSAKTNPESIFSEYLGYLKNVYTKIPRSRSVSAASVIGYVGSGSEEGNSTEPYWNALGQVDDITYQALTNLANYDINAKWQNWDGSEEIISDYDADALKQQIANLKKPGSVSYPDQWQPTLLYTYQEVKKNGKKDGTSYPGPLLVLEPGNTLNTTLKNQIKIQGVTEEESKLATLISNQTKGNNGSESLGATSSINQHYHGAHVNPNGFGDNVISRFTTGQKWTNSLYFNDVHGKGTYWYHPHYHPGVNQQVYGGLTGAFILGDTLSQIPEMEKVPRNLVQLKNIELGIDTEAGKLQINSFDNLGRTINRMNVVAANNTFQPRAESKEGGWQSLTISNQSNNQFYNIALQHRGSDGALKRLPLFIYGEDGHQYPQIRRAQNSLGQSSEQAPESYAQAQDMVTLPAGKRYELLFYLPEGETELISSQNFNQLDIESQAIQDYKILNMGAYSMERTNSFPGPETAYNIDNIDGGYPELSSASVGLDKTNSGAGPIAIFDVRKEISVPSPTEQEATIERINRKIKVQVITPGTRAKDYKKNAIPSVDLFSKTADGKDAWSPIRQRELNFSIWSLVGPSEERDAATQQALKEYTQKTGIEYERYTELPTEELGSWLNYGNPMLINDHVYPNGNLVIGQLGTIEEWQINNWSNDGPSQYMAHPFHIHINDYQVKDADSELGEKRSLEDVTMLNSSGYHYYDPDSGNILKKDPLKGEFISIPEALDPSKVQTLNTYGANTSTIRMLFQDYIGTYVYHCHILVHEDSGMMQGVMVVENTDSSWLIAAEDLNTTTSDSDGERTQIVHIHKANDYEEKSIRLQSRDQFNVRRAQAGDITNDFVQDVILSSELDGRIRIIDGNSLLQGKTRQISTLKPYKSTLAPWALPEDFTGDGTRDLVTGGFERQQTKQLNPIVNINDFVLNAFISPDEGKNWEKAIQFKAFGGEHDYHHANSKPLVELKASQVSLCVGDFNFDNFNDFAVTYATDEGVRVRIIDGAAFSLAFQTGKFENGYLPNTSILADALISDSGLKDAESLVLTSGFNGYAQGAIENLILTAKGRDGIKQYSLQLDAGHFIATSEPFPESGHASHGSTTTFELDAKVTNLGEQFMPLHLISIDNPIESTTAFTPIISGSRANGGLIDENYLLIAQGNGANGNQITSQDYRNTASQLAIDLKGLRKVDLEDLHGIKGGLDATFTPSETLARNQLVRLTHIAYTGSINLPGNTAKWSATSLGEGLSASEFVEGYLDDPIIAGGTVYHFGGRLNDLSVNEIVTTSYQTLFGRNADAEEVQNWQTSVNNGLSRELLPLAIMQNPNKADTARLALLSAGSEWSDSQWGTTANVSGSFGQGLKQAQQPFLTMQGYLFSTPSGLSWNDAQEELENLMKTSVKLLGGERISNTGFF